MVVVENSTQRPLPEPARVPAARVIDARKVYGRGDSAVTALDGVTVEFPVGEFTAVMGPSGSGKSTLVHCVAGLDTLTSGRALLGETDLGAIGDKALTAIRRTRIGFVFQAYNLLPTLSALENITLPADLAGVRLSPAWLDEVIGTVGLRDRLGHRPAELSGGQQQRVAIARALVTRPDLVVADEPTGNLDSRTGQEVLDFLGTAVRELGLTVVMVTHDPAAAAHADRVVFLADGRVVDTMPRPTADLVLDRMKGLGR
jgi:putative ABC transport system ATP-binding protein